VDDIEDLLPNDNLSRLDELIEDQLMIYSRKEVLTRLVLDEFVESVSLEPRSTIVVGHDRFFDDLFLGG
jgi:hypothetical protein